MISIEEYISLIRNEKISKSIDELIKKELYVLIKQELTSDFALEENEQKVIDLIKPVVYVKTKTDDLEVPIGTLLLDTRYT